MKDELTVEKARKRRLAKRLRDVKNRYSKAWSIIDDCKDTWDALALYNEELPVHALEGIDLALSALVCAIDNTLDEAIERLGAE